MTLGRDLSLLSAVSCPYLFSQCWEVVADGVSAGISRDFLKRPRRGPQEPCRVCLVYARSGWAPEGEGGTPTLTSIHRPGCVHAPPGQQARSRLRGHPYLPAVIFPPVRQRKKVTVPSRQGHQGGSRPVPCSTQRTHKTGGLSSGTFNDTKARDLPTL